MAMFRETLKATDFNAIRLRLASPDRIREWSYGEVMKPETINYRTQKPEKTGLFAEEIFGPSKDWECYCGKYKKIRFKGIVCDKCGVEVTHALVRRERMAHIELASPVSHIWFLRGVPSKIGTVLEMSVQQLEKVIYFANFIITEVNEEARDVAIADLQSEYKNKGKMIEGEYKRDTERAHTNLAEDAKKLKEELKRLDEIKEHKTEELESDFLMVDKELKEMKPMALISETTYQDWSIRYGHIFEAGIGAEAIQGLLSRIKMKETVAVLEKEMKGASKAKGDRIVRRVKLMKSLIANEIEPDWMILQAVPVTPPDLRPMVPLDGGRFATSDLNDLYRRVINRNNRLRRLHDLNAPEVITRNEKRMLQEAVDALLDNSARHSKTVIAATGRKRQLKSLADNLKGKQGRFRQNLLGKRIDYSGRSVIVVGPHLKLGECGIPKRMALELFKPFVISRLIKREFVYNIRSANRFIEADRPEVWDILEEIVETSYVLLNRAPTLHRLGIQAFRPILIEGKAIQVHPLVCDAFNADFDGDQMAVHVPLTRAAKQEAKHLMLASNNLLKPSDGNPIARPGKDIVWGCFYLTMVIDGDQRPEGSRKSFPTQLDAEYAYSNEKIGMRELINVRLPEFGVIETTVGRLLVNEMLPSELGYFNETMGKKQLSKIVREVLEKLGRERTVEVLDNLKALGFKYSTLSGFSWGMSELPTIAEKPAIMEDGTLKARQVDEHYEQGLLTVSERHSAIVKIWTDVKDKIEKLSHDILPKSGSAYTMIESGARGSIGQLTQMIGMKGLVQSASGEVIELPVKRSFKEGMDVLEFFISSHGVRKGLTDTALKTANAGYLTRRLVDVAQDVVVVKEDCGDEDGVVLTKEESDEIGEPLAVRILGRYTLEDIKKPGTRKIVVKAGEIVMEDHIREIDAADGELQSVRVRSVVTCLLIRGLCEKCYGYDLAYNKPVKHGTAVGIIAAQSIGEPGTQLTMRTFHMGGVAGKDITQGLPRVEELFEARSPKHKAIMTDMPGKVDIEVVEKEAVQVGTGRKIIDTRPGQKIVRVRYGVMDEVVYKCGRGGKFKVKEGDVVQAGDVLCVKSNGDKHISEFNGSITIEKTHVKVAYEKNEAREYVIPPGFSVYVKDGDEVEAGDAITEGHLDLQLLFQTKGRKAVERYVSKEIQFIYASQGQKLNNKHIEVIVKQMFSRVRITDPGATTLLPGEIVERATWMEANRNLRKNQKVAVADELFQGITKVSLSTDSWLSAASFQETSRVLINAAVTGKVDKLSGLKENVIIGKLIPAGTGVNPLEYDPEFDRSLEDAAEAESDDSIVEAAAEDAEAVADEVETKVEAEVEVEEVKSSEEEKPEVEAEAVSEDVVETPAEESSEE
ncbi:MAG TPA: DNA-directed RNA polymerase subunit beta' [Patescibacteria group bacterium]|nr:DNA-directed RNA polymerase subunit beta' [Patescibacteria group bacterium]